MSWPIPVPAVNNASIVMTATGGRKSLLIDIPPKRTLSLAAATISFCHADGNSLMYLQEKKRNVSREMAVVRCEMNFFRCLNDAITH